MAVKLPNITKRIDATGRTRFRVQIRRSGYCFTETYATLAEAIAGRDAALARSDDSEAPAPPLAVKPTTAGGVRRATTVFDASDRLIRGMAQGSARTKTGQPYKPSVIRK